MSRKRELYLEVEAAGRIFTFNDALLELTGDDPEILDAYFATAKIKKEYEGAEEIYIVKAGDSISKIAQNKGTTVAAIIKSNPKITNANKHNLKIGQKIVLSSKKLKGEKISFTKINDASVGDEVYIVVKTLNFRDKKLSINVKQGKENGIVEKDDALTMQQNDKDVAIVKAITGDMSKTKYLNKDDFKDYAITKIKLQPKDKDKLKLWNDKLKDLKDKKTKLYLLVDAHTDNPDLEIEYHGRNPKADGKADMSTIKNHWLDIDGKWFELKDSVRAPWMIFAEQEYKTFKGINENTSPLKEKIEKYFDTTNAVTGKHTSPWCAAFVNWCFEQTKEYKGINTGLTALAFDWAVEGNSKAKASKHKPDGWINGEKCDPFYGAVIVLNYSHTAFIVGKNTKANKYVYLGGNQGSGKSGTQKIQYGSVTIGKEFMIMKPKKYKVSNEEKKLKEYNINKDGSYETTR